MRLKPKSKTQPVSAKELANRERLPFVVAYLNPLRAILNKTFAAESKGAGFNKATSFNYHTALTGEFPRLEIRPELLKISVGTIRPPMAPRIELCAEKQLCLHWEYPSGNYPAYADDLVHLLIYNPDLKRFALYPAAKRADESYVITIHDRLLPGKLHCYVYACDRELKLYSPSECRKG